MRWEDVDLDNALWTLPKEMTKAGRLHEVPLSPLAIEILTQTPKIGSHVFTTLGDRPISGFSAARRRCDALSEVTGWRLHDLRRTVASGMARLGIQPHIIEKVLNHATGTVSGVAAVYNRHGYLKEKYISLCHDGASAIDSPPPPPPPPPPHCENNLINYFLFSI